MRRTGAVAALAGVALGGVVAWRYQTALGRARAAASQGSRVADLAIGPVEYADYGSGPVLLSIHGAGGGLDQGLAIARELAGGGFRIIAPSRFGYLRTPVPSAASPAAQADAHAALLDWLAISRAMVIGVSAGARSAVELALRHPDRVAGLILVSPALHAPGNPVGIAPGWGNALALRMVGAGTDFAWWAASQIAPSLLIRFVGVRPGLLARAPAATQARIMHFIRAMEPVSLRVAGVQLDSNAAARALRLDEIAAPTLIIAARDDLFNTLPAAQFAAARIPGARLILLESGGHLLVGHEREVRTAIRAFLRSTALAMRLQPA